MKKFKMNMKKNHHGQNKILCHQIILNKQEVVETQLNRYHFGQIIVY